MEILRHSQISATLNIYTRAPRSRGKLRHGWRVRCGPVSRLAARPGDGKQRAQVMIGNQAGDLGLSAEPPDRIEPSTYALRDQNGCPADLVTRRSSSGIASRHLAPLPRRPSTSCGLDADRSPRARGKPWRGRVAVSHIQSRDHSGDLPVPAPVAALSQMGCSDRPTAAHRNRRLRHGRSWAGDCKKIADGWSGGCFPGQPVCRCRVASASAGGLKARRRRPRSGLALAQPGNLG